MPEKPVEIINAVESVPETVKESFFMEHAWVAWIILAVIALKWILDLFPLFDVLKARIFTPLAKIWKFKSLQKKVVQWDIEGNVNEFVQETRKELPTGWANPVKIEWMKSEKKEDFLEQDEVVIRMRPVAKQQENFVRATHHFFQKTFFPRTKRAIPDRARKATSLQITRRLIQANKPSFETAFQDHVLEPEVQKDKRILDFLDRLEKIDKKGFFTGSYLRELHALADQAMYSPLRDKIDEESAKVLKHIEEFSSSIGDKMPESAWKKNGLISSYGFLLVAAPFKIKGGSAQYVKRAEERLVNGADRLYVLGSSQEKWFFKTVVKAITNQIKEYELVETFGLHKDYRGEAGGMGALFVKKGLYN